MLGQYIQSYLYLFLLTTSAVQMQEMYLPCFDLAINSFLYMVKQTGENNCLNTCFQ